MFVNKRGDLEIRTVVLVAIGLIVLFVVVVIFLGGTGEFMEKFKSLSDSIWGMKEEVGFIKE